MKGTIVDFNELEHALDNTSGVGSWQLEMRKANNDPLELDEIVLHITSQGAVDREALTTELANLLHSQFEFRPNKILFHSAEEMRTLQQVGVALKEQKVVDNRPKVAPSRPDTHQESKP